MLRSVIDLPLETVCASTIEELLQRPNFGPKKVALLIHVLRRIAADEAAGRGMSSAAQKNGRKVRVKKTAPAPMEPLDWDQVPEHVWQSWGQTVLDSAFSEEALGRVAPELNQVPTVIWHTPMSEYCCVPLAELRLRRTHGDKRLQAILSSIQAAAALLDQAAERGKKLDRLRLPVFTELEQWSANELNRSKSATYEWVTAQLLKPQLKQLEQDVPALTYRILSDRLGWDGAPRTVMQLSKILDLTRARVYQHLEIVAAVMDLRWPEGRAIWQSWHLRLAQNGAANPRSRAPQQCFELARQILYPD
jgi:hypothetical protein